APARPRTDPAQLADRPSAAPGHAPPRRRSCGLAPGTPRHRGSGRSPGTESGAGRRSPDRWRTSLPCTRRRSSPGHPGRARLTRVPVREQLLAVLDRVDVLVEQHGQAPAVVLVVVVEPDAPVVRAAAPVAAPARGVAVPAHVPGDRGALGVGVALPPPLDRFAGLLRQGRHQVTPAGAATLP